ncbi:histidine phosphatase family protein [Quadrisphaera sp. DSM 44207]|uniref:histidine phosphatase family protein n=1 Tax=Quadrisphaera sp. DSM 44207 TaxID=1881057 RepID=UPI0008822714|nr:histidine phosphatase family protein [Quadrisphaera sp. DSM 44207]SDQ05283.1 probable phosphoglycerate mutase [Quadrisphaera sp. DSM 44207]
MSAARVVLWRHGRTASNAAGRFQGQLDVPLDGVGREQARRAAAVLARLEPARLVASDLSRAADTAQALADLVDLPVLTDPDLRELHAGVWQGLLAREIREGWPQMHAAWRGGEDVAVGGGERRSDVGRRVAAAVRRHAEATADGGTLVLASHGGAVRAGVLELLGLPAGSWPRLGGLANCRWAVLAAREDGWSLTGYDLGPDPEPDPAPSGVAGFGPEVATV